MNVIVYRLATSKAILYIDNQIVSYLLLYSQSGIVLITLIFANFSQHYNHYEQCKYCENLNQDKNLGTLYNSLLFQFKLCLIHYEHTLTSTVMFFDYFLGQVLDNQLNNEEKNDIAHDYIGECGQGHKNLIYVIGILEIIQLICR